MFLFFRFKLSLLTGYIYPVNSKSNMKVKWLRWSRSSVLSLVPKFAGSHPAEALGFLGRKIRQHAFFRRGSKAVGPMSQIISCVNQLQHRIHGSRNCI